MGTVYNILEMCPGSHYLPATQKESCGLNTPMAAVGYISDTEEIVKSTPVNIEREDMAIFNLSVRSLLPPDISAKDLSAI
jgi:hypothetical protein